MYMVMELTKMLSLHLAGADGQTKAIEAPLDWAEGMVGVCPVFDTKEHAEKYKNGLEGEYEIKEIKEVFGTTDLSKVN